MISFGASRMKVARDHRVPLSSPATAILIELRAPLEHTPAPAAFVFTSRRARQPLSNMAVLATLKRMGRDDATTHWFRSIFRHWAAERTDFPREVAEAALAHAVGDAVEAAYRPARRPLSTIAVNLWRRGRTIASPRGSPSDWPERLTPG